MGIFSQKFENPKPRFPEGKIPEPEKTRSQKPDLDPDPEMSTPNPPRPRLLLPDYITRRAAVDTATRRVCKIHVVVGGKTVSEILKIHTFLISIFNPLFDKITTNFKL